MFFVLYIYQWSRKQLWIGGGPKCIGRMTQNNINPVNNNAINKDKYTNVNDVSNLLRSIHRILKLRNPEKNLFFFGRMVPFAYTVTYMTRLLGGASPAVALLGGPVPPSASPVPTPLYI